MVNEKNILILGSPRSGTHALGSIISKQLQCVNLGELFLLDDSKCIDPDINLILDRSTAKPLSDKFTSCRKVAHIVQMTVKLQLSSKVSLLKEHCEIISLRRRNKILQFASWMYFHKSGGVFRDWHNHNLDTMAIGPGELHVTQEDIDQFLLEQMLDDFFCPEKIMYYEDIDFSSSDYQKNIYVKDITTIFSNLDFVEKHLAGWKYHDVMIHGSR